MQQTFGFESTAEEVARGVDLHGKNVIVTGGYAGLGRETCRVFAKQGAKIFLVGRDLPKAIRVAEELKKATGNSDIIAMEIDLSSFTSVRIFADKFAELKLPLHFLILNAGIMACPHSKTKDGFEYQFGTNFLGHFLLANLLLPSLLQGAPGARVVSVSSSGHVFSDIRWDDFNFEKEPYEPFAAYGQSKTGNILFAVEFNRLYKSKGVVANSIHPGYVDGTDLGSHIVDFEIVKQENLSKLPNWDALKNFSLAPKTTEQGTATTVYAALSLQAADGGKFYFDCQEHDPLPYASSQQNATRLWELATKLVHL